VVRRLNSLNVFFIHLLLVLPVEVLVRFELHLEVLLEVLLEVQLPRVRRKKVPV
jgi:hypothetical protein